jgi:hypothetical protein
VKIGEALSGSSGKVERLAKECVGSRLGHEAESMQGSEAALDAFRLRRGGGGHDADGSAWRDGWWFDQARHFTMPLRER